MSWDYGWNAQSSLLPDKQVPIKVTDKGNEKIKALMQLAKEKTKNQLQTKAAYFTPHQNNEPKKNKGIDERNKRDQEAQELFSMKDDKSLSVVRQQLEKKQKLYEEQEKNPKRNHSSFLVDFVEKELSKEDEELEQLKKEFYAGKLQEVLNQQKKIHESEENNVHDHMRENLAWEKEVLEQLNEEFLILDKSKVAQSFDRKLTEDEKKALDKVINERLRERERMIEIKKQREEEDVERIRKLKKLNILDDSDEEENKE